LIQTNLPEPKWGAIVSRRAMEVAKRKRTIWEEEAILFESKVFLGEFEFEIEFGFEFQLDLDVIMLLLCEFPRLLYGVHPLC
jgi:hypothetical protein